MSDHQQSRREFLSSSAKVAGLAGLAAGGCSAMGGGLAITAGPKPPRIDPKQTIRMGVIGVGSRGRGVMWQFLNQPNVEIAAIADPQKSNQQEALKLIERKKAPKPDLYDGEEDYKNKLLARDDIDAVLLAVPCYLHTLMYLDCFAAGKHFYGEKPMSITVKEADAMVAAQKKNPDVIAQIGFQRRASGYYQEEIKRIRNGELGMLIGGYGAWNTAWGPIGLPSEGSRVWLGRQKLSGDWMLEQACHTWDVFNWIADDMPVAASGMGRRDLFKDLDPKRDVTDFYMAHVEYPGELAFDFEHSWVQPRKDSEHVFSGVFERVIGKNGGIDMSTGRIFPRAADGEMVQLAGTDINNTTQSAQAFSDALRNHTQPASGVDNGRAATLAGLLVRKAVYERRRVTINELL